MRTGSALCLAIKTFVARPPVRSPNPGERRRHAHGAQRRDTLEQACYGTARSAAVRAPAQRCSRHGATPAAERDTGSFPYSNVVRGCTPANPTGADVDGMAAGACRHCPSRTNKEQAAFVVLYRRHQPLPGQRVRAPWSRQQSEALWSRSLISRPGLAVWQC